MFNSVTFQSIKNRLGAFRFYFSCIVAMAAAGYGGYTLNNVVLEQQNEELQTLRHTLDNLKSENDELIKRLNILGVELEVSRLANQQAQQTIQEELQAQVDLQRELSFYQKVMAPELSQEGFVIDSFKVIPTGSDNYYRFNLVLLQHDKRRERVKGELQVTLTGSHNGKPATYALNKLIENEDQSMVFSFRYFEVIKGEFTLPEGFVPEEIQVQSVLSEAKWGKRTLDRSFTWQAQDNFDALANT